MNIKTDLVDIKRMDIINIADILYFAEANGISWNKAHDILFPCYSELGESGRLHTGVLLREFFDEGYNFRYSKELKELMLAFFDVYNLTEVYLTTKGNEV